MTSFRRFVAPLAICALIACGHGPTPERTVRRFFRAMNEKDINQLLTCFDPRQERLFKATFRIVEKSTGVPLHDLFEMMPGLQQAFGDQGPEDFSYSNIRVLSRKVSDSEALISVSAKATYRSRRQEQSQIEKFDFVLQRFEDAGWRIIRMRTST
jgi:hypothetical protein